MRDSHSHNHDAWIGRHVTGGSSSLSAPSRTARPRDPGLGKPTSRYPSGIRSFPVWSVSRSRSSGHHCLTERCASAAELCEVRWRRLFPPWSLSADGRYRSYRYHAVSSAARALRRATGRLWRYRQRLHLPPNPCSFVARKLLVSRRLVCRAGHIFSKLPRNAVSIGPCIGVPGTSLVPVPRYTNTGVVSNVLFAGRRLTGCPEFSASASDGEVPEIGAKRGRPHSAAHYSGDRAMSADGRSSMDWALAG
jgi:hypothetical protein